MGRVGVGCYVGLSLYTCVLHYGKKVDQELFKS
jgi:hypothetical protein